MIRVRFLDTSTRVSLDSHIFVRLLKNYVDNDVQIVTNRRQEVDFEFVSNAIETSNLNKMLLRGAGQISSISMEEYYKLFRLGFRNSYRTKARNRIWFTGENLRAPSGIFDATFSFDKSDHVTKNIFFPYWFHRCNWFGQTNVYEIEESIETLMQPRKPMRREKTVVTFSSEYEIFRLKIIRAVEKVASVQCYGKFYKRYASSKLSTSSNFGLQICNENSFFPNYVTEKLQESWIARNVPIWAGVDYDGYFNKEAFVDVTTLVSEEITERIRSITPEEIMYRQSQPLLIKQPNLNEAKNMFFNLLNRYA